MQNLVSFQFYIHPKNIEELLFLFQRGIAGEQIRNL